MRRGAFALAIGVAAFATAAGGAAPAPAPAGALSQLAGKAGCVFDTPDPDDDPSPLAGVCAEGRGLSAPTATAISPDGRNLYVAGSGDDAIAVFARDGSTGTLRQLAGRAGCVAQEPEDAGCSGAEALFSASELEISPDGANLYAVGHTSGVAVFRRDARSGALEQLPRPAGCIASDNADDACTTMTLDEPDSIAISQDGRSVYVGSLEEGGLAVLARDPATGALRQLDGSAGCLTWAARDTGDDDQPPTQCATADGLESRPDLRGGRSGVTVSPNGQNVYVATDGALAAFARSANGSLTQLPGGGACLATQEYLDEGPTGCKLAHGLGESTGLAITADGKVVIMSSWPIITTDFDVDGGVAVFTRAANGALSQAPDSKGCLSDLGAAVGCTPVRGFHVDAAEGNTNGLSISPDGRSLYVTTRRAGSETGTISVFTRNADDSFSQLPGNLGCIGTVDDGCGHATSLQGATSLTFSGDGAYGYATAYWDDSIVAFARSRGTARLTVVRHGTGTVRSTPAGVRCPTRCSFSFPVGTSITLVAVPAKGSSFAAWAGACHGKASSCKVVLEGSTSAAATFRRR
jgi:DNA-binding beta-propeller fold protein YncE